MIDTEPALGYLLSLALWLGVVGLSLYLALFCSLPAVARKAGDGEQKRKIRDLRQLRQPAVATAVDYVPFPLAEEGWINNASLHFVSVCLPGHSVRRSMWLCLPRLTRVRTCSSG